MKRVVYENGENCHGPAKVAFALAHRATHVSNPPAWLLTLKLAPEEVNKHMWDGSLIMHKDRNTLAFKRTVDPRNFPGLRDVKVHPVTNGDEVLQSGYDLLQSFYPVVSTW